LINSVGIICNLISVCNVHFDQYIFDSLNLSEFMHFSGWVYIIEQVNLYGISTKKNHYLQVRLFTKAAFLNPTHNLQMRLLPKLRS